MARRMITALFLALVVSGLATFWLSRKVNHPARTAAQAPDQSLNYVAATRNLDAGEIIRREDLTLIDWPKAHPLSGSFLKPEDVVGRAVLYPLSAGEPVLDKHLAASGSGVGLTARIPAGMRAIALRSDEVVGVAGFLLPGTHVDVLVTYHDASRPDPVTATVLQDAEVLAAGHQVQPDPAGKPASVDVVTLLLTPADAEKAVMATAQGNIHFVLRNGGDHGQADAKPLALGQLVALPSGKAPLRIPLKSKAPAPQPWVVETLMGQKRSTQSFN